MTVTTREPALRPAADAPIYRSPFGEDYVSISTIDSDGGRLAWIDADHATAFVPAHSRPLAAAALAGDTAIVAPDTPQLEATIRRAIANPGHWTKREKDRDGDYEPLPQWQARAVLAALRQPVGSGQ